MSTSDQRGFLNSETSKTLTCMTFIAVNLHKCNIMECVKKVGNSIPVKLRMKSDIFCDELDKE